MLSRRALYILFSVIVAIILIAAAVIVLRPAEESSASNYYGQGLAEMDKGNYRTASALFWKAYENFTIGNDKDNALHKKFICDRVMLDYCLTHDQAVDSVKALFPQLTNETIERLFVEQDAEHIVSDGEVLYFSDVALSMAWRNTTLCHQLWASKGTTPVYDPLLGLIKASTGEHRTYFNLTNFIAHANLTLPRGQLPATGLLQLWIPAPISTPRQNNVTLSINTPGAVISSTAPNSDLGLIYIEVDLAKVNEDIVVRANYTISEFQVHFEVDPNNIGEYDRTSPLFAQYTASHDNILVTPEAIALAHEIVGEETNPYLQAKMVYDWVLANITYSYVPHAMLSARGIAESENVRINGFGDCGAQSMFYCSLLRALEIPARTCGGYQSFPPSSGTHFWAEFYLPNYGWLPVDVTAAETADWSPNATSADMAIFKEYFFGNLDPYRLYIQNDVDLPAVPTIGDSVQITMVYQKPAVVCEGSDIDVAVLAIMNWSFTIEPA